MAIIGRSVSPNQFRRHRLSAFASLARLFRLVTGDSSPQVVFPANVGTPVFGSDLLAGVLKGHYVWPTLALSGVTAGLVVADPHAAPTFRTTNSFDGFNRVFSSTNTAVFIVIARRYRSHRWVPYVAYGLAGAISFSRITRSDHFPSDVFFDGAMGFVISRCAVLPARN